MMKHTIYLAMAACAAFLASSVHGATVYDGTGSIAQDSNWSNLKPSTAGNPGTVDFMGTAGNGLVAGTYFITQANGSLTQTTGGVGLSNGSWTLNGGSVLAQNNDLTLGTNQIFIQNGGTVQGGADDFIVQGGASYTLNGGALTAGDDATFSGGSIKITGGTFGVDNLSAFDGGNFEISGGVLTLNSLGTTGFGANGGQIFTFNGGTTNVTGSFGLFGDTNPNSVVFGGNSTGSLTAASLVFGGVTTHSMNWLAGSQMSMTITGNSTWAETAYNAGRLLYNGDNNAVLGLTWAEATSGETAIWNFSTDTLSLVSIAPPVSSPFAITSFAAVVGEPGVWQLTLTGDVTTGYVFRSSTNLDFSASGIVENLAPGVPSVGTIGGINNSIVTTGGNGQATVRVTLTGNPSDFIRAESAP